MSILLSLLINFSLALEPTQLEPIFIEQQENISEIPRSTSWPTTKESSPSYLAQPEMSDALNSFSGLQTRSQGSPTFSIRGSAQSGRVLTLFNDIPLNFSSGFGTPKVLLPKELIGKSVVIKGPASLFYGSQAMSGSINFLQKKVKRTQVTVTASDTNESFLPWRKGSLAYHSFHLVSPVINNKNNSVQASFFTENNDGAYPYQSKTSSGVRSHNSQNISRGVISGQHKFTSGKIGYDLIAGKQITQSPGPTNFSILTREDSDGLLASLFPQYYIDDVHSLKTRISYLKNDSSFLSNGSTTTSNLQTMISQNEWSAEWSRWVTTQLFVDYFEHELDSSFFGTGLKETRTEVGPLVHIYFTPHLFLQTGGRYIGNHDLFLPTLGFYYKPQIWKTWINYSEGFRSPSLSDLFSSSPFSIGNPNLKPEESKQWEIGFSKDLSRSAHLSTYNFDWSMDVRAFVINYSNFMESLQPSPGVYTKQNLSEGKSSGFDFSLSWNWGPWENYYKYNYLDAKNTQNNSPFMLSPKHQITWGLNHYIGPFKLEAQNTLWDNYYDGSSVAPTKMENWSQWNFLVHGYGFNSFNFSFGLINAFNQSKELTLNYPEPQRSFWGQVTYKF